MISLREYESMSKTHPVPPLGAHLEPLAEYVMAVAEFHAWHQGIAFYRLTKVAGGEPAGTIVPRDFLERAHAHGAKYGKTKVGTVKPTDFGAVETP